MEEKQRTLTKEYLQKKFKSKEIKLDLGCGKYKKREGFIGVDIADLPTVDLKFDLEKPIPIEDNAVDEIYSGRCLEHIKNLEGLLGEIVRICKNGARVEFHLPYWTRFSSIPKIWHHHYFNSNSFDEFFGSSDPMGELLGYYSKIRFKPISIRIVFDYFKPLEWLVNISRKTRSFYEIFFPFIFPAKEVVFILEVIK
jgi:SAM-dependent methyltransferase